MIVGGIAAGALLARMGATLLRSILVGVEPEDPGTLGLAAAIPGFIAVAASLTAARSAARVDPAVILCEE
jgi:hypothetical protein